MRILSQSHVSHRTFVQEKPTCSATQRNSCSTCLSRSISFVPRTVVMLIPIEAEIYCANSVICECFQVESGSPRLREEVHQSDRWCFGIFWNCCLPWSLYISIQNGKWGGEDGVKLLTMDLTVLWASQESRKFKCNGPYIAQWCRIISPFVTACTTLIVHRKLWI